MASTESYAPTGYYVWWFPGSPLKVHLALEVVRQLREQFQLTGPQSTGEGLLFGKAIEGGTEVLDFEPTDSSVSEAVATLDHDGGRRLLVGYYRIETGDSLRLKESDLALARTWFAQPYHVFLIIQPNEFGPPNASFFFHDRDGKMAEFSLMEFPFEPSLLAGEEHDRLKRSEEAAARRSAAIQPTAAPPPRGRPRPKPRPDWTRSLGLGIVLLLALLCGVGVSANSRSLQAWWSRTRFARVEPPRPAAPLSALAIGLRATRENTDVEITWNRGSAVIAAATSGVLSILDGESRRDVSLDISRIRSSSVVYSPTSDQVYLQLSVTTPVSTVVESVMLLLPNNEPPKSDTLPVPKMAASRKPKRFIPPTTSLNQSVPVMASLPLLALEPKGAPARDPLTALFTQPTLPPPPERSASALSNGPQAGSPNPAAYHAAEPLHRVVPRLLPQLLAILPKPTTLEVRVNIDRMGRVTLAEALPRPGINKVVLEQVVAAARSWTFTPARRGDEPVPSEFVLQFYFAH
jgi:hypothetical protein